MQVKALSFKVGYGTEASPNLKGTAKDLLHLEANSTVPPNYNSQARLKQLIQKKLIFKRKVIQNRFMMLPEKCIPIHQPVCMAILSKKECQEII